MNGTRDPAKSSFIDDPDVGIPADLVAGLWAPPDEADDIEPVGAQDRHERIADEP